METFSPAHPPIDLSGDLYYQVVCTLTDLLPPPLDDTPDGLLARNLAAIAKVAALLPVNANEADLAAQCIAARGQAEDILRLLRRHAGDINLVIRLNAQYASMLRTSLSVHARLMRVQALRHKREAIEGAASQDAWTLHIAEGSMVGIVDPDAGPPHPAWPSGGGAPGGVAQMTPLATPPAMPEAAPAASNDPRTEEHVSGNETNSHDAAFETWLSEQPWAREAASKVGLPQFVRKALARSHSAKSRSLGQELPANTRESPASADYGRHIDTATTST